MRISVNCLVVQSLFNESRFFHIGIHCHSVRAVSSSLLQVFFWLMVSLVITENFSTALFNEKYSYWNFSTFCYNYNQEFFDVILCYRRVKKWRLIVNWNKHSDFPSNSLLFEFGVSFFWVCLHQLCKSRDQNICQLSGQSVSEIGWRVLGICILKSIIDF